MGINKQVKIIRYSLAHIADFSGSERNWHNKTSTFPPRLRLVEEQLNNTRATSFQEHFHTTSQEHAKQKIYRKKKKRRKGPPLVCTFLNMQASDLPSNEEGKREKKNSSDSDLQTRQGGGEEKAAQHTASGANHACASSESDGAADSEGWRARILMW